MSVRSIVSRLLVLIVTACCAVAVLGCGSGGSGSAKTANVKPGSMPGDASWTGVYYNPLYGWLHIVEEGDLIIGRWLRPRKDKWGELQGSADGNLLRFDWTEHEFGLVGPRSKKKGKGYFVYSRPEGDNVDDRIDGELGKGEDEVGMPWDAVKQRNQKPDIESIGGAGAGEVGGGEWDSENQESGEPEEPVEPPEEEAPEL